jgi:PIN domain nuclease of toxin-antitoxin system
LTPRLLLDTHIVLWLDAGDAALRPATRLMLEAHWRAGNALCVSAITAWEIALLADVGRIELDLAPDAWLARFLARPGIEAVALSVSAATRAYPLTSLPQRDPADRLLIATAIELGCPLVTYDERILTFAAEHGAAIGFTALAHPA